MHRRNFFSAAVYFIAGLFGFKPAKTKEPLAWTYYIAYRGGGGEYQIFFGDVDAEKMAFETLVERILRPLVIIEDVRLFPVYGPDDLLKLDELWNQTFFGKERRTK